MADVLNNYTEDSIYILELNRPEKRNALNDALVEDLLAGLTQAHEDKDIACVVIRGAGADFCSGADLASLQRISKNSFEDNLEDARLLASLFERIRSLRVPVIASVHGRALAGGCGLATACDLVLASSDARFGYPEVKIGFVPAMVAAILRRNLSEKLAFELLTQGFEFSANDAYRIGLINHVFEEDVDLNSATLEYAAVYTRVSRSAVEMTKRLFFELDSRTFTESLELGAQTNAHARMTEDCQKGIAKFLEKQR